MIGTVAATPRSGTRRNLFLDTLLPAHRVDELITAADFLVLCCPHTPETDGLLNASRLARMKPEAVVINVARGAVVDEPALIERCARAGCAARPFDVFARAPLPRRVPLWDMPDVLVFPHSASTAVSENGKLVDLFCDNLRRYLSDQPLRNVLDYTLLY